MSAPRDRPRGLSARLTLTLSYAGFVLIVGAGLLAVVWVFLLRYVQPSAGVALNGIFMPGRDDLVRAFMPAASWAMVLLLVVGLVGGWLLAGRMLAPLTRIARATRRVSAGDLSYRIGLEGRHDEFRELADSFDAMVARVQALVDEQQRFAANASHELRTPLAITQTLLEVAENDPDHDDAALRERLRVVNARAVELTEALLTLSRADQRAFARERVDLSLVAEETAETLLPLAERSAVTLECSGDAATVLGSAPLLTQLAQNLVHNAIVHNVPADGWVRIRTTSADGRAVLTVENAGPVLAPALVETLTEPFRRGTDRVRSDQSGVGLGLAIVERIVRAHDGSLALSARAEGGLRVRVALAAA